MKLFRRRIGRHELAMSAVFSVSLGMMIGGRVVIDATLGVSAWNCDHRLVRHRNTGLSHRSTCQSVRLLAVTGLSGQDVKTWVEFRGC